MLSLCIRGFAKKFIDTINLVKLMKIFQVTPHAIRSLVLASIAWVRSSNRHQIKGEL